MGHGIQQDLPVHPPGIVNAARSDSVLGSTSTVLPCDQGRDGGHPATHAAIRLSDLDAPQRAARRIVRKILAGQADVTYTDDVVLVADELVGNAVQHVGAALDISLDVYDWGVAVQVRDGGEDTTVVPAKPPAADEDDEGGRGLFLVDVLASAWGVQRDSEGKRVVAIFLYRPGDADR
jgi:anti-sigma regulatory factor (Ser/Thr protein kinase)